MADPIDLGEYRKWHTEGINACAGKCCICLREWPCPTVRLADEVERLREALAFYADPERYNGGCGGEVARAALEGRSSLREVMECYEYDQYEVK